MADLVIPQRLAETSVTWEGERARDWLAELPRLVAEVGERWDLDVGPPYLPGGAVSWVAPCRRRSDPARLVLKLAMPHPESAAEAAALAAWDGRGAVRLEAHDLERWALLLERCDPGTPIDDDAAGPAVGARLHEAQAPDGIPSLVDVMGRWADEVTARLDRAPALDPGVVALAIETMRTGGGTDDRVLLHGDLNPTNVLRSDRGWLAIDPKPMAGDPAYDGARLILQLAPEVGRDPVAVFGERLRAMAAALGVEPGRVGRWCVADVVVQCTFAAVTGNPDEAVRLGALLPLVVPHAG